MKTMIKSIVAALTAFLGLSALASGTYYGKCTATAVPAEGGYVYITHNALSEPEDTDWKFSDTSSNSGWWAGDSYSMSFYAAHKEIDKKSEFLYWTKTEDGSGEQLSKQWESMWYDVVNNFSATSKDEYSPTTERIYAHFHVHDKQSEVIGLMITNRCVNTATPCKGSCGASYAKLVVTDKSFDGTPYTGASYEGNPESEVVISYKTLEGAAIDAPSAEGTYLVVMTYAGKSVESQFKITHAHSWSQQAAVNGKVTWKCTNGECAIAPWVQFTVADKTFDGETVDFSGNITKSSDFDTYLKGTKISEVEYFAANGATKILAPQAVGSYVAKATIGTETVALNFSINARNLSEVAAVLGKVEFNYTAAEIENTLGDVLLNQLALGESDYEISGNLKGIGSGFSNVTYKVTLTGKGNFTGTKTLEWTIKAPTGKFGDGAFKVDSTLVYNTEMSQWETKATLTWPEGTLLDFTKPDQAVIEVDAGAYNINKKQISLGEVSLGTLDSVESVTWTLPMTPADLEELKGGEVTNTLTVCALAWGNYVYNPISQKDEFVYGDQDGITATNFMVKTATKDLVLELPVGATYNLGATELKTLKIKLGNAAKITSTVKQAADRIFTEVKGAVISEDYAAGIYTYSVGEHEHIWSFGTADNVLTATCSVAECQYIDNPPTMSIVPTTTAGKYCDTTALTASLSGDADFATITGAKVGAIEYFDGATKLEAAPTTVGTYVAKCEVISKDLSATNVISTTLRILVGQAICNGIHVGDAADYFEAESQDDIQIQIGKDFTATKTFVVPAAWTATTAEEIGLTIEQFVTALKNGEYSNLYTWDDVKDLIAGRVTAEELFERLKETNKKYTLLHCGTKTIDLSGFTVTAAEGLPLFKIEGALVLTGEGTLTNGCETLIENEGTLSIESGKYFGALVNSGTLMISGGYFTGAIENNEGTVVLTGGTYEIEPNEDFIPAGYDLVRRDGIYYVEKHVHNYTFLPLGRCCLSGSCWNYFVKDPDQIVQLSNCGAHQLGIFIAAVDASTGVLPKYRFAEAGKPVTAKIVAYNYSAIKKIGILKNLQELLEIVEEVSDAESDWDNLDPVEKFQKMMSIISSIEDLDLDLTDFIWTQDRIEEETGLKFGEVKYLIDDTDAELDTAPSVAGTYRASVVITTPKGNEVTRYWKFTIGSDSETAFDDWVEGVEASVAEGWSQFKEKIREAKNRLPTAEEVQAYFDDLDEQHRQYFENLRAEGSQIDEKLIAAHQQVVDNLKSAYNSVVSWADSELAYFSANFASNQSDASALASMTATSVSTSFTSYSNEIEQNTGSWPTHAQIGEFFDQLDAKHAQFFADLKAKGETIDAQIIAAHDEMVAKLRRRYCGVSKWTLNAVEDLKDLYAKHQEIYFREADKAVIDAWDSFLKEFEDLPSQDDVDAFFGNLDLRIKEWQAEALAEGHEIDEQLIAAHTEMVERLRKAHCKLIESVETAETDLRNAYNNHKTNADQLVVETYNAIVSDFKRFREELDAEISRWPTAQEVEEYFDRLDRKHADFFKELKAKGEEIDEQIIAAHNEMVRKLRATDVAVAQWTDELDDEIRAAYQKHCSEADQFVLEVKAAIEADFGCFCDEVEAATADWPTKEDVQDFFDSLAHKCGAFEEELKSETFQLDQQIHEFFKNLYETVIEGPLFNETEIEKPVEPGHYELFYKIFKADSDVALFVLRHEFYITELQREVAEKIRDLINEYKEKAEEANEEVKQFIAEHVVVKFVDDQTNFVYNATEQGPEIESVTCGWHELQFGDYEVTGEQYATEAGEYTFTIKGHGLFESYSQDFTWNIERHDWQFANDEEGTLKGDCFIKSCTVGHVELSIAAESKDYDQYPVRAEIVDEDGSFVKYTLAEIGEIYYLDSSGEPLEAAPEEPGVYTACAEVKVGNEVDGYTNNKVWKQFEIRRIDIAEATVYTVPDRTEFVYSEEENTLAVDVVIVNGVLLTEDIDYTVGGDLAATEVGNYQIVIEGQGHYFGTRTLDWAVVEPTRPFDDDAFNQLTRDLPAPLGRLPYGEIVDNTLTVTVSTNLWYDATRGTWFAGVTVDWPSQLEQIIKMPHYTVPEKAYVEVTTPTATKTYTALDIVNGEAEADNLVADVGEFYRIRYDHRESFVNRIGWDIEIKIEDIIAERNQGKSEVTYAITVWSPAHEEDPDGLAKTTYTVVLPIEGLVLDDQENLYHFVTFDAKGGTFADGYQTNCFAIAEGSAFGELPTAKLAEHAFVKWQTVEGEEVLPETVFVEGSAELIEAVWIEGYNLAYDLNGGETAEPGSTYARQGDWVRIAAPTRDGYVFAGWTLDGEFDAFKEDAVYSMHVNIGNSIAYKEWPCGAGCDYCAFYNVVADGTTVKLTANWRVLEADSYGLVFDLNGGEEFAEMQTNVQAEAWVQIPSPFRDGYVFKGWTIGGQLLEGALYSNTHMIGKQITANDQLCEDNGSSCSFYKLTTPGAVVTMRAKWEVLPENTYGIYHDLNGGYMVGEMPSQAQSGNWVREATPALSMDGYVFAGWTVEGEFEDSAMYSVIPGIAQPLSDQFSPCGAGFDNCAFYNLTAPGQTVILHANWIKLEEGTYGVVYDLNGGEELYAAPELVYEDDWFAVGTPTREGYTFAGWTTSGYLTSKALYSNSFDISYKLNSNSQKCEDRNQNCGFYKLANPGEVITLRANWKVR